MSQAQFELEQIYFSTQEWENIPEIIPRILKKMNDQYLKMGNWILNEKFPEKIKNCLRNIERNKNLFDTFKDRSEQDFKVYKENAKAENQKLYNQIQLLEGEAATIRVTKKPNTRHSETPALKPSSTPHHFPQANCSPPTSSTQLTLQLPISLILSLREGRKAATSGQATFFLFPIFCCKLNRHHSSFKRASCKVRVPSLPLLRVSAHKHTVTLTKLIRHPLLNLISSKNRR